MLISNVQNSNIEPNFKAHYRVVIPKSAFKNPENYKECDNLFEKKLYKETVGNQRRIFDHLVTLFTNKPPKILTILEEPSFIFAKKISKKINYSLSWFKQNTGLQISSDAANEGFLTFNVYTKKEIAKFLNILNSEQFSETLVQYLKEVIKKYPKDKTMRRVCFKAKAGVETDKAIKEATKNIPVITLKIETLDDLKKVKKMEY